VVHLFRCSFPSLSLTTRLVSPRSNNREGTSLKVGVNWQLLTDHQHYDFMSLPSQASTAPQASALSEQGGTWLARNRRNYAGAPGIVEVDIRPSLSTPCMTRRTKRTILYYSEESRVSFFARTGWSSWILKCTVKQESNRERGRAGAGAWAPTCWTERGTKQPIDRTYTKWAVARGSLSGHFGRLIRSMLNLPSQHRERNANCFHTRRLGLQVWPQECNSYKYKISYLRCA